MKLASFKVRGRDSFGVVVGEGDNLGVIDLKTRLTPHFGSVLDLLRGDGLAAARAAVRGVRADFPAAEVEWLPPIVAPEKILCIGINYANRNADYGEQEVPKYPSMFYRAPNSLVAHLGSILLPPESEQLDYEGEIALVIGRAGRRIAQADALDHVAGITLCNEGTIRDWIRHGKFNVTQGKNWDATGSIGPWLVTSDEVDLTRSLHITVKINGTVTQDDTTDSMIKSFSELIAYVSTFMTLKPGDIIVSGTPVKLTPRSDPPVWLKAGDTIEIAVPEIGILRNTVMAET
jgi:2-keto-4-pentenoate hydratase/2-oxohepta-3-ene-1,7-dioic acid hydratase in catechol pathway